MESVLIAGCFVYLLSVPPYNEMKKYEGTLKIQREVFVAGLFDAVNIESDKRPLSDISYEHYYNNDE